MINSFILELKIKIQPNMREQQKKWQKSVIC